MKMLEDSHNNYTFFFPSWRIEFLSCKSGEIGRFVTVLINSYGDVFVSLTISG